MPAGDLVLNSGDGPYYDDTGAPLPSLVDQCKFVGDPTVPTGYTWNQSVISVLGGSDGDVKGVPPPGTYCQPQTWAIAWNWLANTQLALYAYAQWLVNAIEAKVGTDGSAWSGQAASVFYQLAEKVIKYIGGVGDEIGKLTGLSAASLGSTPSLPQVYVTIPTMVNSMWNLMGTIWGNAVVGDGHDRMATFLFNGFNPDGTVAQSGLDPAGITMWNIGQMMAETASNTYAPLIPTFDVTTVQFDKSAPDPGKDPNTTTPPPTSDPNLDNALDNINKGLGDLGNGLNGLGNGINGLGNGINGLGSGLNGLNDNFSKGLGDLGNGLNGLGNGLGDLGNFDSGLGSGLDNLLKGLGGPNPSFNLDGLGSAKGLGDLGLGGLSGIGGLGGANGIGGIGGLGGVNGLGGLGGVGTGAAAGDFGGLGAAGAAGALGSEAAAQGAAAGESGFPMYPPMGGMGGPQQNQPRERTTFLEEDEDVWGAALDLAPPVLGAPVREAGRDPRRPEFDPDRMR